jgi:hypothetical protein
MNSIHKEVLAWALEEKSGGRKGKLITVDYAPYWHPIHTAVFATRSDATAYRRNKNAIDKLAVVRVKIIIEKVVQDGHSDD